ncbi:Linoleate 13S-lipoxygenase 2-1, chloroplastic [Vitis vinifera]|uniref:Linoleate 13S-lipoxygenase 2-1, chloroplastic n=1 Tax=Vitis vinifera TaxID=29760 RepID=A0A438JVL8_VITVI|nr:Linoleate 13S-lipoxygenase 2-1, chloroplastic [Vitis vinifera]
MRMRFLSQNLRFLMTLGRLVAVLVQNEQRSEMYLKYIVLNGLPIGPITFNCCSWVHSKFDNPEKRIFFTNKSYLPSQTPRGLKSLRKKELRSLRGNGEEECKAFDRIYDYDTYNDLGDPTRLDWHDKCLVVAKNTHTLDDVELDVHGAKLV